MPTSSGAKKAKPMNKKNLQHFEKRLLEERGRVLKELGHYDDVFGATPQSADGDLSSYSFHMADQGTDAMEREKAFLFASQEGRFLWHIDQALRRLYKSPETFGKCHNCGEDIAFERLDALPHARYAAESFEIDVQEIADVRPFVPLDRPRLEQRHPIESGARQHPRHR